MKRILALMIAVAAVGCLGIFMGNLVDTRNRRVVENCRIAELRLREAHPTDVLLYLQQEASAQLPEGTPAFVIHPELMRDLAWPILTVDANTLSNFFGGTTNDPMPADQDLPSLPSLTLDRTNETLLNILQEMERQGAFKVEPRGRFILLRKHDGGSQHPAAPYSEPAARSPQR